MSTSPLYWLRSNSWSPSRCRVSIWNLRTRRFLFRGGPLAASPDEAALLDATPSRRVHLWLSRGTARMGRYAGRHSGCDGHCLLESQGVTLLA